MLVAASYLGLFLSRTLSLRHQLCLASFLSGDGINRSNFYLTQQKIRRLRFLMFGSPVFQFATCLHVYIGSNYIYMHHNSLDFISSSSSVRGLVWTVDVLNITFFI